MGTRIRFLVWLLAVVAAGLAAYVLTAGRAYRPVAAPSARSASETEVRRAASELRHATDDPPETSVESTREAPWASADAVAFHGVLELVYTKRISAARSSAKQFYASYPTSPYGERVQRLTGVEPRSHRRR